MLKSHFACLKRGMCQSVDNITLVCQACIVLHNMTRVMNPRVHQELMDTYDGEGNLIPGAWRQHNHPRENTIPVRGYRGSQWAQEVRDYLRDYFADRNRGAQQWQWEHVFDRDRYLY